MKKIRLIYNKSAGQNKGSEIISEVIGRLSENGFEVTAFRASKENSCEDFIKNSPDDTYAIVVAGGDGTINKVVNFMKKHNINVPLGIIPAGTSNDFALHLGVYGDVDKAVQRIIDGNTEGVGIEEYFNQGGITIIEWAKTIKDILPEERLEIKFKIVDENKRVIVITPYGQKYEELCEAVL